MKFRKPTLHVTILTLFLTFLFVTAGSLTYYNYEENSKATINIAEDLLSEVSRKITWRVESLFESTVMLTNEVSELSYLPTKPDFMSHPAQWFLVESLLARPNIYSVYIGFADGDFYQLISLPEENGQLRDLLNAPKEARLAVRRVFDRPADGRRIELWQFLNRERRMVGSKGLRFTNYDPRNRPWFQQAMGTEEVIHTGYYIFGSTDGMGMTFARRFDGNVPGVFGVDITLDGLSRYFADQKVGRNGFVFMFNEKLQITAHPDPASVLATTEMPGGRKTVRLSLRDLPDPLMGALADAVEKWDGTSRGMVLRAGGVRHLVHLETIESQGTEKEYLAVAAPLSDFTGYMDRTRTRSLIFAGLIILLAIPIAVYNARLMSRPLNRLAREADKIRHFNLDSPVDVESKIAEIADLSKAVKAMQQSLSSFGRYVPKTLVKRMLLTGMDPVLGGARREATMLFTDIADFTSISESMEAEKLMLTVSEYMQEVGSVILENGGTIDKYIGDAIMAFWNAPTRQKNHAELACEAALQAREASSALNAMWRDNGMPELFTRFGIHTGEPIIGNVGSDDRINYTAMGAPVNLASRLEGLNKYYGTQILVSETVVRRVEGKFAFRSVGKVMPKGLSAPIRVFELMGRSDEFVCTLDSDNASCVIELWETGFASYEARKFEDAAEIFERCLRNDPSDRLAATMLERARALAAYPPGEDWDMTDVFKTK